MVKKSNVSQIDDYNKNKIAKLAEEKLLSSGLDLEDAAKLHIDILTTTQTTPLLPELMQAKNTQGALRFGYYDLAGQPIVDRATREPYHRIRLLGDDPKEAKPKPATKGAFGSDPEAAEPKRKRRPARYFQPAKSLPHPYFPTNLEAICYWDLKAKEWLEVPIDWPTLAEDPSFPIIITEGELKAAKACQMQFPTISVGGVYAWKSGPHGLDFLPEMESDVFLWHSRRVYICFDSDVMVKPEVAQALEQLSEALVDRGADVHIIILPSLYGEDDEAQKVGLDDFFVGEPDAEAQFRQLILEAHHFGLARPLLELNKQYVYVKSRHFVMNLETLAIAKPQQFRETEGNINVTEPVLKNGKLIYERVAAAPKWLKWPLRHQVHDLVYEPGQPRSVGGNFNMWKPWAVEPKEGDVAIFLKLVDHIFDGADQAAKDWFLRWLAYPIQHPGTKLLTAAAFWSAAHGVGKSVIGKLVGKIYGPNYSVLTQKELHGSFNAWAHNKQFVLGEEITGAGSIRQDANMLKNLITADMVWVNQKNVAQYEIRNCINFLFTSNHPDAFYLEDDDRRFFVHRVTAKPLPESFYLKDLAAWERAGGIQHLFHYLLHLDLADFDPMGRALETESKKQMIEDVRSELALWVRQLRDQPDTILKLGEMKVAGDIFSSAQLINFYHAHHQDTTTTTNAMTRELKRANVPEAARGYSLRTKDGKQTRYFIVRDQERWLKASPGEITSYLNRSLTEQA